MPLELNSKKYRDSSDRTWLNSLKSSYYFGVGERALPRAGHCPGQLGTVSARATPGPAQRPANTNTPDQPPTSTRRNPTNMDPIDAAIAAIESPEDGEKVSYTKVAARMGVDRSTLARRHQGRQAPRIAKDTSQRKLDLHQEAQLVQYIKD